MGEPKAKITLVNDFDRLAARLGLIKDSEVRQAVVPVLADTGAWI